MKQLLVSVLTMLSTAGFVVAQNDGANKQKYWKFRTDFRENYVKIGPDNGESLPAGMRKPHDCVDNVTQWGGQSFGEMHWGDGMIRHGHYLGLLATEYRLLKNAGKDVTGVLNELYFALRAFNRTDKDAEPEQSTFAFQTPLPQSLNGFFLREDVGEDFATDNWGNDDMRMRCTNSAFYRNNNAAKTHDLANGYWNYGNSYQNVPSQDQVSSLLTGFSLVDKLVDNVWVQPSGETEGFYVVTETEAIVHRMVNYFATHNWFIIDVNGWPVNNGGGDLSLTAYPILKIAERITGNSMAMYNHVVTRRPVGWHKIYYCMTGLGPNEELSPQQQANYCSALSGPQMIHMQSYLEGAQIAGPLNNQTNSLFQTWQLGSQINYPVTSAGGFWSDFLPGKLEDFHDDYQDDGIYNTSDAAAQLEWLGWFDYDEPLMADYSETIVFNFGVASNLWSSPIVSQWADNTQNRQLELIHKVLNNGTLSHDQAFYRSFLDNMGYVGAYHLRESAGNPNEANYQAIAMYPGGGWASEYRWTHPTEAYGNNVTKIGLYSNLDYMLYHNLYWLAFNSGTQMTETNDQCPCGSGITYTPIGNESAVQQNMIPGLNEKLTFLPTCVPSALAPTFNLVTTPYTIQPKFSDYINWNIFTTKYQLQNATIETGASLTVKTHLVLCDNATVTVKPGAFFYVDKSYTQINVNAAIDVEGDLRVRAGTELLVRGKLRIKNGGKLIIEDGAKVILEPTGVLEYYNGALVQTIGGNSSIEMKGVIKTMDATTFWIQNTGPNTSSAKLFIDGTAAAFQAEVPAYFKLEGKGPSDQFIVLRNGAQLKITDPDITTFRVADCGVLVNGGTSIRIERPYYSYNTHYRSTATNGGFTVAGAHVFSGCHFVNVPVKVPNYAPGTASVTFAASNCNFSSTSSSLNTADLALVKVTGGGYSISGSTFVGARSYCIESSSMVVVSSLSNCTLTNLANSAVGATLTGVQDVSNVELKMTSCNVQKMQYGVNKSNGKLTLKCNYFGNNNLSNIRTIAGCILNMSINDFGGYNNLYKSLQNKSIEINNCTVNLKDGYNFIESCNATISGTTSFTCIPPGCQVDLAKNQWNNANTVPSTALFQITSANGYIVLPLVTTVAAKPACGYYDGQIVVGPPRSAFDTDGMPVFYSAIYEDSVRLDVAIVNAMLQMTAYDDTTGNDLRALNRLNEVFTADLNTTDSLTSALLWFALPHMKTALESAFINEQLQTANNALAYDTYVGMYAHALTRMNPAVVDSNNYLHLFYHEIDKAHLLRLIGHADRGLHLLTELESCGLAPAEQAHLNHWKQEFEKDLVIAQIGIEALDTTILIDTSGYLNPALATNGYSFGAIMYELNNIEYPNCSFYAYRDRVSAVDGMLLFPNPATEEVHVYWEPSAVSGNGKLTIAQTDGRYVFEAVTPSTESGRTINTGGWKPGTYLVCHTDALGKITAKKLIIQ